MRTIRLLPGFSARALIAVSISAGVATGIATSSIRVASCPVARLALCHKRRIHLIVAVDRRYRIGHHAT
jgi:hypothetical protein